MDDPRDEHRMSPFFTLPRELRDTIYGYLLDLEIRLDPITLPDKKGWLNINGHLRRSVCLVNRQIYHEYLKQLPSHMNLTMDLWYGNIAGFEKVLHNPNFRRLLSRLRHLAVIYRDQYDQVARRKLLAQHAEFRDSYLQHLPNVQTLQMALFVDYHNDKMPSPRLTTFDKTNKQFFALDVGLSCGIERRILLGCHLFSVRRTSSNERYWNRVQNSPKNLITLWATPNDGPYAWRRLVFTVLHSSTWRDFERWKEVFDAGWNA